MKKIIYVILILFMFGCATAPTNVEDVSNWEVELEHERQCRLFGDYVSIKLTDCVVMRDYNICIEVQELSEVYANNCDAEVSFIGVE